MPNITKSGTHSKKAPNRWVDCTYAILDLLAVIHRDEGQYTAEHGIEKSAQDAVGILDLMREKEELSSPEKQKMDSDALLRAASGMTDEQLESAGYDVIATKHSVQIERVIRRTWGRVCAEFISDGRFCCEAWVANDYVSIRTKATIMDIEQANTVKIALQMAIDWIIKEQAGAK